MVAEKFQIYSVKITANTFLSQKIGSVYFYSCPPPPPPFALAKLSLPGFYHYLPGRRELLIPPKQRFLKIFSPEEKGSWWGRTLKSLHFRFMFCCAII